MRKLLVLLAGLLLASPGWSAPIKGLVDHIPTADLPTCDATRTGYRVWDTTLGYEVTCGGVDYGYIPTGVGGDLTVSSTAPTVNFDDIDETGADATADALIQAVCPTEDDCDLVLEAESGAFPMVMIRLDSIALNDFQVKVGDVVGNEYLNVDEAGMVTLVGAGAIMAAGDTFQICGENTTINNNTVYYGPNRTLVTNTSGMTCDINAAGDIVEANVIASPNDSVYTSKAVYVTGMVCRNEADSGASISYTLRTAAGATVPSVTCTINGTGALAGRDCVADIQTTTAIAAGASVTIAAASTSDIADNNGFICNVRVAF